MLFLMPFVVSGKLDIYNAIEIAELTMKKKEINMDKFLLLEAISGIYNTKREAIDDAIADIKIQVRNTNREIVNVTFKLDIIYSQSKKTEQYQCKIAMSESWFNHATPSWMIDARAYKVDTFFDDISDIEKIQGKYIYIK
jgi:hypothetical protein